MITPAAAFYELFLKTVLISCHHFMILDFFQQTTGKFFNWRMCAIYFFTKCGP